MNQSSVVDVLSTVTEAGTGNQAACLHCGGALADSESELFDTRFGIGGSYEVRRCSTCGLEQTSPAPDAEALQTLYETYYNFGGEQGTFYTKTRDRFLASFWYRLWMQFDGDASFHSRKGTGRLLDIGCNEGRSMKIFARNGFQPTGLELSERAAAVARVNGFTVHACKLGEYEPATLYDVAVLSNVLEHSRAPRQMLESAVRVLKPGGEIWISCPNSRSWLRSVFGRHWINWHVPFHISHFSASLLGRMLARAGCNRVKVRQVSPAAWLASSLLVAAFFSRGKPTQQLRNPILFPLVMLIGKFFLFPFLWVANKLGRGDCLVIVATKI